MAPFVALTRRPIASMVAASLLRGGPLTTGATDVCGSTELVQLVDEEGCGIVRMRRSWGSRNTAEKSSLPGRWRR